MTCSHIDARGQFAIVQSVLSPYHVESRDATKGTNLGKFFAFPPTELFGNPGVNLSGIINVVRYSVFVCG